MFKRSFAVVTLVSIITLFPGRLMPTTVTNPVDKKAEKKSSCSTCPTRSQDRQADSASKLGTLGKSTQVSPIIPLKRSLFDGLPVNLVSTATGRLAFAVTDLNVPGAVPLTFQRTYVSDRGEDVGLGAGWSFIFNDRIKIAGDAATLTDSSGAVTSFRRDGQGQRFVAAVDNPGEHQQFELSGGDTIIERAAQMTRIYKKLGEVYRLSQVTGAQAVNIAITYDRRGNIDRIANDPGGAIMFQWSDEKDARLLGVTDTSGGRTSFRQDGRRLRAVIDSANAQWTYDYAGGKLRRAADPLGRILLRVRYDSTGHVIEAGDAAGVNRYDYNFTAAWVSQRTVITDPMDAVTIYEHTERGALATVSDDEGRNARIEYNAANRPVRLSDSQGNEAAFAYDSQNRLIRQSGSGVTNREYAYDETGRLAAVSEGTGRSEFTLDAHGNIIASRDNSGKSYSATYNARRQVTSLASDGGNALSFEYDSRGNETAYTYSGIGRFEQEYDTKGRKVIESLPSGLTYNYQYDARGHIARESDNRGRSIRAERDAGGALTGLVAHNGRWVRATRDEAGRIIKLSASNGKSRHLAYDARGALTDYTNAAGKRSKLKYDRRGRLQKVTDYDGVSFNYHYDRNDKLVSVKRTGRSESGVVARFAHAVQGIDYAPWCFGGPDGFMTGFNLTDQSMLGFGDYGNNCTGDPFGGLFGGGSGLGGLGGFGGFGGGLGGGGGVGGIPGETCLQCRERQARICRSQLAGCVFQFAAGAALAAAGVCLTIAVAGVITAITAPILALICAGVVGGSVSLGCFLNAVACTEGVVDKCPQCNGGWGE